MKLKLGSLVRVASCIGAVALAEAAAAQPASAGELGAGDRLAAMQVIREHFAPGARLRWHWPQQRAEPGFCGWVSDAAASGPRRFFVVGERRGAAFVVREAGLEEPGDRMVADICASWGYPPAVAGGPR